MNVRRVVVAALAAVLSLSAVALPARAATPNLTVLSSGTHQGLLLLPAGAKITWSAARISGKASYAAVVLDRFVPDRRRGAVTAVLAQQGGDQLRTGPSDSTSYPAGYYRLYVVADQPVRFTVPVSGLRATTVNAQEPLRAAVDRIDRDTTSTAADLPAREGVTVAWASWSTHRAVGAYREAADLCATSGNPCTGRQSTQSGVSTDVTSGQLGSVATSYEGHLASGAHLVTHLSGTDTPAHVRALALTVHLATSPAPVTSGSPMAAAIVVDSHLDFAVLAGRLGQRFHRIYPGLYGRVSVLSVSPDGTQVAFSEEDSYATRLAVVFTDGTGHRFITPEKGDALELRRPVWSPDGTKLFFASKGRADNAQFHTYVVPADGTTAPRLLPMPADHVPTGISPTGNTLMLDLDPGPGERWSRAGRINVDGSGRRVFDPDIEAYQLAPSGRFSAAARILRGDGRVTVQSGLVDPSTGHYRGLEASQTSSGQGVARPVGWTPDSKSLYVQRYGYTGNSEQPPHIYRIDLASGHRVDLTPALGSGWEELLSVQPMH